MSQHETTTAIKTQKLFYHHNNFLASLCGSFPPFLQGLEQPVTYFFVTVDTS